ncbi:MAG TPA: hypothetical protein VFZ53_26835, partial [Polyangiaceae bacterium]
MISIATQFNCLDNSTTEKCNDSVTRIDTVAVNSTTPFADYIDYAGSRAAATFRPLELTAGWTKAPLGGNFPGYAVFDSTVHLRGSMAAPANR